MRGRRAGRERKKVQRSWGKFRRAVLVNHIGIAVTVIFTIADVF
jgi:hypothetical protein